MSQLLQPSVSLKTNPLLSQWLRFEANGSVTVFTGKAELGQGILHALKLMAAHELDLPLDSVHIETANTQNSPDEGMTSGSLSVQDSGLAIRQACAHAAQLFKKYACSSYAELHSHVDVKLPVDLTVPTKSSALTLTEGRDDIEALVQGQPIFLHDLGINVDLTPIKNLRHGRMVRGPGLRCTLRTEGWADAVAGLPKEVQAFRDGSLVGVVAPTEELAEKAASKLQRLLKWDVEALPDCREGGVDLVERAPAMDSQVFHEAGQFHEASKDAKVYEAVYFRPALHHGSMGPSVALAVWESDQANSGLKVWSHTQGIFPLRKDLALAFGVGAQQIEVQHMRGAGCYGHNGADDVAWDAAWLAQQVPGRPVRVQWTRQAELGHAPLAPAMAVRIEARLGANGQLSEWTQTVWGQGHGTRPGRGATPALLGAWQTAEPAPVTLAVNAAMAVGGGSERNAQPPYDIASVQVINHRVLNMPFRVSAMRALGAPVNVLAAESVMDEWAHRLSQDPLAFRLAHLQGAAHTRAVAVLQKVADMAAWSAPRPTDRPDGWGRGLAYARYKNTGAWCAVVVELVVAEKVRLHKLWIAADLGHVVDAEGAANQLEGGALQAASWALCEATELSPQGITSNDWSRYPILKFSDMPDVQVHLMHTPDQPSLGAGECSSGPCCAAIANAIFDAIGVRVRGMPFTPDNLMRAIEHHDSHNPSLS